MLDGAAQDAELGVVRDAEDRHLHAEDSVSVMLHAVHQYDVDEFPGRVVRWTVGHSLHGAAISSPRISVQIARPASWKTFREAASSPPGRDDTSE